MSVKHNSLIPIHHYLPCPGGPLKYCLEGHNCAIFKCSVTSNQQYIISISTKIISCNVSTSEICRNIDPKVDGNMLEMALSNDNNFAAAFTSTNQLVIVNIMVGSYLIVENPFSQEETILGLLFTIESENTSKDFIAVYSKSRCRLFNLFGEHVKDLEFKITFN